MIQLATRRLIALWQQRIGSSHLRKRSFLHSTCSQVDLYLAKRKYERISIHLRLHRHSLYWCDCGNTSIGDSSRNTINTTQWSIPLIPNYLGLFAISLNFPPNPTVSGDSIDLFKFLAISRCNVASLHFFLIRFESVWPLGLKKNDCSRLLSAGKLFFLKRISFMTSVPFD